MNLYGFDFLFDNSFTRDGTDLKTLNYSGQREAIKTFVSSCHNHPTADVIYSGVREKYPKISLSTVYRNLALLSDMGELLRFSCGDGKEHYDHNTHPHLHFICKECGSITDAELPKDIEPDRFSASSYIAKQLNVSVESEWTYVYGLCEKCASVKKSTVKPPDSAE